MADQEKGADASATFLAEIVGDEALAGKMMPTGAILDMMDILAGRVAHNHTRGMVATVSFDRVEMVMPVCHMDLVRVEGQLVLVGASSMVVRVVAFKHDMQTRRFVEAASSYITMVAINPETLRPNKSIPRLALRTDDEKRDAELVLSRRKLYQEWAAMQAAEDQAQQLHVADVEDPANRGKREYLTIAETTVEIRKQCLPRHLNFNQTLFGGDILQWMEQAATYAAKRFTGNSDMVTLRMDRVAFAQPITPRDVLEMRASVVYVRKYVLQVQVTAFVDRGGDRAEMAESHTGYFDILNLDGLGFKRPIMTGIRLSDDNVVELRMYQKAKKRHYFELEHAGQPRREPATELERIRAGVDESDPENRRRFYLS